MSGDMRGGVGPMRVAAGEHFSALLAPAAMPGSLLPGSAVLLCCASPGPDPCLYRYHKPAARAPAARKAVRDSKTRAPLQKIKRRPAPSAVSAEQRSPPASTVETAGV